VPSIVDKGVDWFRGFGTEKSTGFTLYSLSGHVTRPGQYEAPLGVTLRELLDVAGGVRAGHRLKFWTPGGSSTPILTDEHLDVPLDYEGVGAAGSMLGTKALQIFDETTCVVRAVLRWTEFYAHESCGKCTPCREGTYWMVQILKRLESGEGDSRDIDTLLDACDNILGRSFLRPRRRRASPSPRRCSTSRTSTSPTGSRAAALRPHGVHPFRRDPGRKRDGNRQLHHRRHRDHRAEEHADHPCRQLLGIQVPRFCDHPLLEPLGAAASASSRSRASANR